MPRPQACVNRHDTHGPGFAGIVAGLLLRHVGRMARHRRRYDTHAMLLLSEDPTRSAHTVICAIEVDCTYAVPIFNGVIEATSLGWNAGIGNHHVEGSKVGFRLGHGSLNRCVVSHVDLISFGCDAELLRDALGQVLCYFRSVIPDADLCMLDYKLQQMKQTLTFAPASARPLATSVPMPPAPPVMITVRLVSLNWSNTLSLMAGSGARSEPVWLPSVKVMVALVNSNQVCCDVPR